MESKDNENEEILREDIEELENEKIEDVELETEASEAEEQ